MSPRTNDAKRRLHRLLKALGLDVPLREVNQEAVNRLAKKLLAPDAAPGTLKRGILNPLRAVLVLAEKQGWCDYPHFVVPRESQGRTNFLLPRDAMRVVAAANPPLCGC